jgi:hypothetical protein
LASVNASRISPRTCRASSTFWSSVAEEALSGCLVAFRSA